MSAAGAMLWLAIIACSRTQPHITDRPHLPDAIAHDWSMVAGGASLAAGTALAAHGQGVIAAVTFEGTVRLGDHTLASSGASDGLVARLDARGKLEWVLKLGGPNPDTISALATAAGTGAGDGIALALSAAGPVQVHVQGNETTLEAGGEPGALILMLSPERELRWAQPLHTSHHARVAAMVMAGDGSLIVAGTFAGTMRLGQEVLTSAGATDMFVARLGPGGEPMWVKRAGGAHADSAHAVATRGDLIAVAGAFGGRAEFGLHVLQSARTGRRPGQGAYVALFDLAGQVRQVRALGGQSGLDSAWAVALGDAGQVYVAGVFGQPMSLDQVELASQGDADVFVVSLHASGEVMWATSMGGPGRDHALALALDPGNDGVWVAGTFADRVRAGSFELESAGGHDLFAIKLTAGGDIVSALGMGSPGQEALGGLLASPAGTLTLAGSFEQAMDMGGRLMSALGAQSAFIARLHH